MTNAGTCAPSLFWDPAGGARHRGFVSADPEQRAAYIRRLAAAAGPLDEVWTNSRVLAGRRRCHPDLQFLLDLVTGIVRARDGGEGIFRPASGLPVLAVVLDLPVRIPASEVRRLVWVLAACQRTGVSVTLVVPALADPCLRAQASALESAAPRGAAREVEGE